MTKTLAPLTTLDEQITDALGELRGARETHAHCPSGDNQRTVQYAELRLNRLLERRYATRP
jgi:hypothetical protein